MSVNRDLHEQGWWRLPLINLRAWTWSDAHKVVHTGQWHQNAVIYQIAGWSFQDTGGGGHGDLPGIVKRLDYISSLGADAVWLTPIYPSPRGDFGYDVSAFRGINEGAGSMEEFRQLLTLVHQRRMKLIMDMVWNHTSDQHDWFRQSRESRDNPRADWYVWRDPAADGGPPNNWRSVLTGESAWRYEPARGQYYLFNFFHVQPKLNWYHPPVQQAILDVARFWLDQGIDGMRLDAVNFYGYDPEFRDDPPRQSDDGQPDGIAPDNPAARHRFVNSFNRPETFDLVRRIRDLSDRYPGTVLLGEVALADDSIRLAGRFTEGTDHLHLAYHSALIFEQPMTPATLRGLISESLESFRHGGTCWMAGNHDFGRIRAQWKHTASDAASEDFYKMMAAVLLCLPGALCLWQGDELGLPEARIPQDIPPERLHDPAGRMFYPDRKGRDGSRTPMPWDEREPNCGFTRAEQPWLPIPDSHRSRSVRRQHADADSMLNTWRTLLNWRIGQPALQAGQTQLLKFDDPVIGLLREYHEQRLLCLFNVSGHSVELDLSNYDEPIPPQGLGFDWHWNPQTRCLQLPPWGVFLADLWQAQDRDKAIGPDQDGAC